MSNIVANAKSIFLQAVDLSSPEDRSNYLDVHCCHDLKLRRQVEVVLPGVLLSARTG